MWGFFQEDFFDLPLAVAGFSRMEDALSDAYLSMEMMEGNNQYRCDNCNKLVNASKVSYI